MSEKMFQLNYEIVDEITKENLKQMRDSLREDIDAYSATGKDAQGYNVHPEDAVANLEYLAAVQKVLKYFGVNS